MKKLKIDSPSDKQKQFLLAKAKHIAFGGARGGGKSWAVRTKAKLLAIKYPGIKILIVRRSYPELINNHINILRRELTGIAKYVDKDKVLKFPNGSTVNFTYCACDADLDRMQGVEYDVIFLDEATQLSEYQMKTVTACMRGVNNFPKRVYYTCNPGGQGHGYIKRLFIDRRFEDGEDPDDYVFIRSLISDNKVLLQSQPDYLKQLSALPPKLKKAWLEGSWDIFDGQFFEEFKDLPEGYLSRKHPHVIEPFEIPDNYQIYRSFDWGYNKPFSCGWWAVDRDGTAYRILELYGCTGTPNEGVKWTPDKVFSEIHRIETEHRWLKGKHIIGIADPAIWDAESGESLAERAAKYRVFFSPGDNKRIPGWMQMHYRMTFDENGYAMLYVFKNCRAFIRTLPSLRYDSQRPEDLDTDGEDHIADETRYFCMHRQIKPREKTADGYSSDPKRIFLDIDKKDVRPPSVLSRMEVVESE